MTIEDSHNILSKTTEPDANSSYITQDAMTASHWLKQSQLLAYPTESVWGIGCDAYNELAVQQILTIKNRPIDKGLIVITNSIERLAPFLASLSIKQRQQVVNSWSDNQTSSNQQATTWLLPLNQHTNIPNWITGKHNSIAVRVIAHPLIKTLCHDIISDANLYNPYGFLISTSCNPATKTPATTFNEAYNYFGKQICYLQGDTLGYTQPSQIRDALTGDIIR